ncbi:MAG: hypothetical protein LKM32_00950 [Chiayiivirga sp.]|jgi:hypothetical protein|uniref:hypothetical protein n=1 Tax=Chiayiivirga sp. TaxID=2041042 RepID=UPI0025C357C9|nr:hypothetical protein [Chiayiivirga sp.]MCI1711197.1 hypothetical protein [Chiayiivirga sp.]MCI1728004.1 hypothetical protein [Chiayiivirga sp.]
MANARSACDALFATMLQQHEATEASAWGKRCLAFEGEPFALMHRDGFAVRVNGRALVDALKLEGSTPFDPLNPDEATMTRPGWVRLPALTFGHWEHFALAALDAAREARWKNVSWQVPPTVATQVEAVAPSSADSLAERAKAALSGSKLSLSDDH